MCNAHNHPPNCNCGWGEGANYSFSVESGLSENLNFPSRYEDSNNFLEPNTQCPVCGASVFFYQSPTGGRVFFDELGPPWPKHPCTDNLASNQRPISSTQSAHTARIYKWQKEGWSPFLIDSITLVPTRNCSKFTGIFKGESITLFGKSSIGTLEGLPFLAKKEGFDEYKISSFKIVGNHTSVFEIEIAAFLNMKDALINHEKTKALPKSSAIVYKTAKGAKLKKTATGKLEEKNIPLIPNINRSKRTFKNTSILRSKFHWLTDEYKVFNISRVLGTNDSRIKIAKGDMDGHLFELYFQHNIQLSTSSIIFARESEFDFHELFIFHYDASDKKKYKYKKRSGYVCFQNLIDVEDRLKKSATFAPRP